MVPPPEVQGLAPGPITQREPSTLAAVIFDVDGVLLASPHERAWREALTGFGDSAQFTTGLYQAKVAGKSRQDGARAALEALGVANWEIQAGAYAKAKQTRLEALIAKGGVRAFPDALRLVAALASLGFPMAVASASKNASAMLRVITLTGGRRLADFFAAEICGRDLARGKPDPEIFSLAAAELGIDPHRCLVIEDATSGIMAARAAGMTALGVARLNDAAPLRAAGADLVVSSLDEISLRSLKQGRLGLRLAGTDVER
ncbi:HAD family hydrolase [Caulobacter sp. DWP3-1-3b2]|uniref:HAD family hydrolase n=1 Tax=Caulobacter sp. DWP3-1-3b2 TaxID=2804643 RepID=UPI003CEDA1D5